MSKSVLRLKPMLRKASLSKSVAYDLMSKGEFPTPIKLSARTVGWLEDEIDSWIDERVRASRPSEAQ